MSQVAHTYQKIRSPWFYMIVFIVPTSVLVGHAMEGGWHWLTPLLVFGVIPVLDHLLGVDKHNPFPQKTVKAEGMNLWQVITWMCAPIQLALIIWGGWVISHHQLSLVEVIGLTVSVGVSSGVLGINVSHELQHRVNHRAEVWLSRVILMSVGYLHWSIEHVAGHHRHVATPRDPATARFGESFYQFLPRTIGWGFISAWQIESRRLVRQKKGTWSLHNRMIRYIMAEFLFAVLLTAICGWPALPYWLIQSAVAIILLEIINYVEHYGLRRPRRGADYAPVQIQHSWNSSHWLTNHFLFNLQRHADHHYQPGRRYPYLRHFDESPQLPTGYAGMILLAIVPPLWRFVMDERVRTVNQHRQN